MKNIIPIKRLILFALLLILAPAVALADRSDCETFNEEGDSLLNLGLYDEAIATYRKAQKAAQREGDLAGEAVTLTNQGVAYRMTERNDSALICYEQALTLAERSGDNSEKAHVLCSIAILYTNTGRLEEGETYARQAVDAAHKSGDIDMIMYCDYTCGSILTLKGKFTEAIGILRRMAGEARRQNRPNYMLKGYTAILDYFLKIKENGEAATADSISHYINLCDEIFPKVNVASPEALGYLEEKYMVYRELGQYRKSLDVQRLILSLRSKGMVSPTDRLYTHMARNYYDLHEFKDAANCYEMALGAKDSVYNAEINSRMSEFSVRFDTQQKELEIARLSAERSRLVLLAGLGIAGCILLLVAVMLVRRGVRLKSARRYIEGMEEERDRLGHELHDGIAGDLLGLSLSLEAQPLDETASMLRNIHADVRRISHGLMPPRFEKVSLQECMADFLRFVPGATFEAEHDATFSLEISFQIYRIMQETITNIRKHACATYIRVTLHKKSLTIENDGYSEETTATGKGSRTLAERASAIKANISRTIENGNICRQIVTWQ